MKKKGNMKFIISILLAIVGVSIVYLSNSYNAALTSMSFDDDSPIEFVVEAGSSTKSIGRALNNSGLIKSERVFGYRVKKLGLDGKLRAGDFTLNKTMALDDIIESLAEAGSSKDNVVTFTIPEGFELREIAEKLDKEELVEYDRFMELVSNKENFEEDYKFLKEFSDVDILEGFLFPATYEIFKGSSEEEIIAIMLDQFEKVYKEEIQDKIDQTGFDLKELITMASLVEKEARKEEERPTIAAVYYNRLDIGMKLQCDATVIYAMEERPEVVLYKDLEIDSPYNTYFYPGLPIGPISSVGLASIRAALEPEDTDFLYYVARSDGSHIFTKTYDEHKAAIKEAREED